MSYFKIIGKDCEDLIMEYKEEMESYDRVQDLIFKYKYWRVVGQLKNKFSIDAYNKRIAEYVEWSNYWEFCSFRVPL